MSKGAKKEEEKIPEYISKHNKLYGHAKKLSDTIGQTHTEAYTEAVKKHLTDGGEVDFDKLDDAKIQEQFVKTMSDMYISKARAHFKVSKDLDDLEKEMLMQAYSGVTTQLLKQEVGKYGKRFTHQRFDNIKAQLNQRVSTQLYASAGSHLNEENVRDIVKHIGLENKVDAAKTNLEEARELLGAYHQEGTISDSILREIVDSYKLKKKEKEKK